MTLKNHCMFDKASYNVSPIYISNSQNIPKSKKPWSLIYPRLGGERAKHARHDETK